MTMHNFVLWSSFTVCEEVGTVKSELLANFKFHNRSSFSYVPSKGTLFAEPIGKHFVMLLESDVGFVAKQDLLNCISGNLKIF